MDYSATICTTADLRATSRAIRNEMDMWWSTRVERTETQATIRFYNSHVTFAFDAGATDRKFSWTCIDAKMIIDGIKDHTEWNGTKLLWEIAPNESGNCVTLTHIGLNHALECHRACVAGWAKYFENSLKNHLNGETPHPETG